LESPKINEELVKKKGNIVGLTMKAGRMWEVTNSDVEMAE
jgi:hypothetical protein